MMSIKTVNALSHYTDWTVGHVHAGALGWVGLISMGTLYYLVPRMFGQKKMYSVPAINLHFWIATIGIVLYIAAMWMAGVMQGLMWRDVHADGSLVYTFVEGVKATFPFYVIRLAGGLLYLRDAADGLERRDGYLAGRNRRHVAPCSRRRRRLTPPERDGAT
jgi:cytochrome c oxidase cbb3-type subunit 1